jgi:DnaJ-class molecular chaperone
MAKMITCKFCGGKGREPYFIRDPKSECRVCRGTGMIVVKKPLENTNPISRKIGGVVEVAYYLN